MGLKGMKPCVFCDEWGSAARSEAFELSLAEQFSQFQKVIQKRFHAQKYLAYFQAYTNTFLRLQKLRGHLLEALEFPEVVGVVLGTRPDCLSAGVLDLWNEISARSFIGVELGVQTFSDSQLEFLQRGHSADDSKRAIERIAKSTSVNLGIHLIFGLPGETDSDIVAAARICNQLPIQNVKLHHLHVLRNTPLEQLHSRGQFQPVDLQTYAQRVAIFLDELNPAIAVHRLAAYAPRWDELVAPAWTADKMRTHQTIIDHLHSGGHFQGRLFNHEAGQAASGADCKIL